MRLDILLLAVALLPLAGCAAPAEPAPPSGARGADVGPVWSFTDTAGQTHSRDEPPANATILFFMATWCSSCKRTAPVLADVHADYAPLGVRTYSVTTDPSESDDDLERWMAAYAQPWPHGTDASFSMQQTFGISSQSSVVLLGAEGRVVRSWGYGQVTGDVLRGELDALVSAA